LYKFILHSRTLYDKTLIGGEPSNNFTGCMTPTPVKFISPQKFLDTKKGGTKSHPFKNINLKMNYTNCPNLLLIDTSNISINLTLDLTSSSEREQSTLSPLSWSIPKIKPFPHKGCG